MENSFEIINNFLNWGYQLTSYFLLELIHRPYFVHFKLKKISYTKYLFYKLKCWSETKELWGNFSIFCLHLILILFWVTVLFCLLDLYFGCCQIKTSFFVSQIWLDKCTKNISSAWLSRNICYKIPISKMIVFFKEKMHEIKMVSNHVNFAWIGQNSWIYKETRGSR